MSERISTGRAFFFDVPGQPAPQGSKNPWGSEDNPRTRPWRHAVTAAAAARLNGAPLLTGPIRVDAHFYFPRPKSHYRTGRHSSQLRPDAPKYHASSPDLDKLARAIGDALAGVAFRDDRQIAAWGLSKTYGDRAHAIVQVSELA